MLTNLASKTKPTSKKVVSPKRKAPKRNPWESGSDLDVSIEDFDLNDSESDFVPRKTERRKGNGIILFGIFGFSPHWEVAFLIKQVDIWKISQVRLITKNYIGDGFKLGNLVN